MTTFDTIASHLERQAIELPSWAFGNSGTRFRVFTTPGTPRDPFEKIADAAQVHRHTGLAPTVALHIPWDRVDDYSVLRAHAESHGVALGTINSNTFQDDEYKFGSLAASDPQARQRAIDHHVECIDIMHATGSRDLKIWLADGTNYPGQDDMRRRQDHLAESLATIYDRLGDDQRLVLEYKFFEPVRSTTPMLPTGWTGLRPGRSAAANKAIGGARTPVHHAPEAHDIEFIACHSSFCVLGQARLRSISISRLLRPRRPHRGCPGIPFQLFLHHGRGPWRGGAGYDGARVARFHARTNGHIHRKEKIPGANP